ncbi:MAG TPA: hypothetical protein GXZ77_03390 [Papillibacter sp.]|nr:hypothetical protein [Papillibacter sp.]
MKKILLFFLVALLLIAPLSACRKEPTPSPSPSPTGGASPSPSPSAPSGGGEGGEMKMGLGIVASVAKSKNAGEADGAAQTDMTIAAVVLDKDGKIVKCVIDAVSAAIAFNKNGELVTPPSTEFKSKDELADEYGMKKASSIGKEWYEQAQAFASYVEGKTIAEVKDIKVDEQNYPTGADLKSSVTVSVGAFMQAIEKAASSAQDAPEGLSEGDALRLGIVTDMSKSASATAEKDGTAQLTVTVAATTQNSGGVITGNIIDSCITTVAFTKSGTITTDLSTEFKSKNEMGEGYGMKKASAIGKEWNEQAKAFSEYVVGKTLSEVKGISVSEGGTPQSEDLKSEVTISIGDFIKAIEKSAVGG